MLCGCGVGVVFVFGLGVGLCGGGFLFTVWGVGAPWKGVEAKRVVVSVRVTVGEALLLRRWFGSESRGVRVLLARWLGSVRGGGGGG